MGFRTWLRAGLISVLSLALCSSVAIAQGNGHGHEKHDRDDDEDQGHGHGKRHGRGHEDRGYSDHDRDELRGWYGEHRDHLPPGLAKKDRLPPGLERQLVVRGTLPPGLRAKIAPCPVELERRLPPPPPEYQHVFIGGNIVLLNRKTFVIADVFHFEVNY